MAHLAGSRRRPLALSAAPWNWPEYRRAEQRTRGCAPYLEPTLRADPVWVGFRRARDARVAARRRGAAGARSRGGRQLYDAGTLRPLRPRALPRLATELGTRNGTGRGVVDIQQLLRQHLADWTAIAAESITVVVIGIG